MIAYNKALGSRLVSGLKGVLIYSRLLKGKYKKLNSNNFNKLKQLTLETSANVNMFEVKSPRRNQLKRNLKCMNYKNHN